MSYISICFVLFCTVSGKENFKVTLTNDSNILSMLWVKFSQKKISVISEFYLLYFLYSYDDEHIELLILLSLLRIDASWYNSFAYDEFICHAIMYNKKKLEIISQNYLWWNDIIDLCWCNLTLRFTFVQLLVHINSCITSAINF